MYYCINCQMLHEKSSSVRIFLTGFMTLPSHEKFPLGMCQCESNHAALKAVSNG
ncbi:DUF3973 domain-containing protein [Aneurinibacillus terranovensis]|uniref:DUF3973 domain-containing protein n=1 Tax=Aneurinibacillus terranovensis TaxID=278991 RepID=UPI003CCBF1C8